MVSWLLMVVALGCLVYLARILMDYVQLRQQLEYAYDRTMRKLAGMEESLQEEVAACRRAVDSLPKLQKSVDDLNQRLHKLRRQKLVEKELERRLHRVMYKMQLKRPKSAGMPIRR